MSTTRLMMPASFNGNCKYCNQDKVKPPRKTFCSAECVHEYRIRTSVSYLREQVYKRDKGICAGCGLDTKLIAKQILTDDTQRAEFSISKTRKVWKRKLGGGLWDADHIVPVASGGGMCGLENIRTLCITCHKAVTWSNNCLLSKRVDTMHVQ